MKYQTQKHILFLATILTLVFVVLKVGERIDWHWKFVLLPFWTILVFIVSFNTIWYFAYVSEQIQRLANKNGRPHA